MYQVTHKDGGAVQRRQAYLTPNPRAPTRPSSRTQ